MLKPIITPKKSEILSKLSWYLVHLIHLVI